MKNLPNVKLFDLTNTQRSHLAWRLDHKTSIGLITACRIARGELGNMALIDIFQEAGKSRRSAIYHARKVVEFTSGV